MNSAINSIFIDTNFVQEEKLLNITKEIEVTLLSLVLVVSF